MERVARSTTFLNSRRLSLYLFIYFPPLIFLCLFFSSNLFHSLSINLTIALSFLSFFLCPRQTRRPPSHCFPFALSRVVAKVWRNFSSPSTPLFSSHDFSSIFSFPMWFFCFSLFFLWTDLLFFPVVDWDLRLGLGESQISVSDLCEFEFSFLVPGWGLFSPIRPSVFLFS